MTVTPRPSVRFTDFRENVTGQALVVMEHADSGHSSSECRDRVNLGRVFTRHSIGDAVLRQVSYHLMVFWPVFVAHRVPRTTDHISPILQTTTLHQDYCPSSGGEMSISSPRSSSSATTSFEKDDVARLVTDASALRRTQVVWSKRLFIEDVIHHLQGSDVFTSGNACAGRV